MVFGGPVFQFHGVTNWLRFNDLDLLLKKRKETEKIQKNFKDTLWQGDIDALEKLIRVNLTGKRREKALNKWNNYFHANSKRMQYALFESEGLPRGS